MFKPFNLLSTPKLKFEKMPPINISLSLFSPHLTPFTKDLTTSTLKTLLFLRVKPFFIGDHIKIMGYEGKVESANMWYLRIKKKDRSLVFIPTSMAIGSVIEIIKT